MLRRLGLRQRIIGLFVGGALVMVGIVGFSLRELAELQRYSEAEREAELRSDAIHAVVLIALQTAATFSSLVFDLTTEEQRTVLAKGEATLAELEARRELIDPMIAPFLTAQERQSLLDAVGEIRRSWEEIKNDIAQGEPTCSGSICFRLSATPSASAKSWGERTKAPRPAQATRP
jgi:hypothetical protein